MNTKKKGRLNIPGYINNLFISLIFVVITQGVLGQNPGRQYIGASVGPYFPTADFKSTDLSDPSSGFANTGVIIKFNYAYRLTHNFGIYAIASYGYNNLNTVALQDEGAKLLQEENPQLSDISLSVENTRAWNTGGLMVGPYSRVPLTSNLSWDTHITAGLGVNYSPEFTIRASYKEGSQTGTAEYIRKTGRSFSFLWSVGTGFKYNLGRKYLLLFVDYQATNAYFERVVSWDWDGTYVENNYHEELNGLSAVIGLGWFL